MTLWIKMKGKLPEKNWWIQKKTPIIKGFCLPLFHITSHPMVLADFLYRQPRFSSPYYNVEGGFCKKSYFLFILVENKFYNSFLYVFWGVGHRGSRGDPIFLRESSSWIKIGLHLENQLPGWSGSVLKVCGGWFVVYRPITLSLQLKFCWVELGCDKILNPTA